MDSAVSATVWESNQSECEFENEIRFQGYSCCFERCTNPIQQKSRILLTRLFLYRFWNSQMLQLVGTTFSQESQEPAGGFFSSACPSHCSYLRRILRLFSSAQKLFSGTACSLSIKAGSGTSLDQFTRRTKTCENDSAQHAASYAPSYPFDVIRQANLLFFSDTAFQRIVCSCSSTTALFSSLFCLFQWLC